jgi:hypothetical protein
MRNIPRIDGINTHDRDEMAARLKRGAGDGIYNEPIYVYPFSTQRHRIHHTVVATSAIRR